MVYTRFVFPVAKYLSIFQRQLTTRSITSAKSIYSITYEVFLLVTRPIQLKHISSIALYISSTQQIVSHQLETTSQYILTIPFQYKLSLSTLSQAFLLSKQSAPYSSQKTSLNTIPCLWSLASCRSIPFFFQGTRHTLLKTRVVYYYSIYFFPTRVYRQLLFPIGIISSLYRYRKVYRSSQVYSY